MFEYLDEIKVFRDPIHGYVQVKYKIIWDCINSKEFQRLRRIRQLGGAFMVYHCAEHSRFSHSLGVYEIIRLMIEENQDIQSSLSKREQVVVMLAGLLHDLGHGPYSHAFESITHQRHELMTERIITEESEVHRILAQADLKLADEVASVIHKTHPNQVLIQMVSGQLDADRMDYLLRDAYFTGTTYGEFDIARVLRTIKIKEDKLVIKQSGMHSVEDYIMARYHMYWQVYFHPVARSYEKIFRALFKRYKDYLNEGNPSLFSAFDEYVLQKDISLQTHYEMDESTCDYGILVLSRCDDIVLSDLAQRLLCRRLFNYEDVISQDQIETKKEVLIKQGYDPRYYLLQDSTSKLPYVPYDEDKEDFIYVLSPEGDISEISEKSVIVSALMRAQDKKDEKIYYPKEIKNYD